MAIELTICPSLTSWHVGVLELENIPVQSSGLELQAYCQQVAERSLSKMSSEAWNHECQEIRQLLRYGKFKAAGRSKPAQEYLAGCVSRDGALPVINGPVDLLNAVSLEFNLPISLLSLTKCSRRLHIARGQTGELYVFNSVGQELDLTDLITTYDASTQPHRPVGSPIKDSLAGKIESTDRDLVAIIYSPNSAPARQRCQQALERLEAGFQEICTSGFPA